VRFFLAQAGASPYGVENLAGNFTEWVTDRFHKDYYSNSPARSPKGHDRGNEFVIRGGSWAEAPAYIRTTYRSWYNPNHNLGFRCVRPLL
jgi:formylglycine-generating enzyme required for sulfatase activity